MLDEYLHPCARMFEDIADLDAQLVDEELGVAMRMERAEVSTPIELDVAVEDDGRVTLVGAPPTQHVETTYMPVLHRIRMVVTADAG